MYLVLSVVTLLMCLLFILGFTRFMMFYLHIPRDSRTFALDVMSVRLVLSERTLILMDLQSSYSTILMYVCPPFF